MKSEQYWEKFSVLPADLEYLTNLLVEEEEPKTLEALARALIRYRNEQLVELAKETLSRGRIYRPSESYEEGETLIFPHLGNLLGEVVAVRRGNNPEYEPFSVIRVQMEDDGRLRQFAADLAIEHPLNEASYLPAADADPEEIYQRYGRQIKAQLREQLENSRAFTFVGDKWFVRDLIMEIPPVQLNIAEAMLDMAEGGPLPTEAFLEEMDFPEEISPALQVFSLEYALLRDGRFDEVGPSGQALWYLRAMEPEEVLQVPERLRYMPIPYNRSLLDETMLALEARIDDEWIEGDFEGELVPDETVTVTLIYPHWRSGTLPLTAQLSNLFPTAQLTDHIRFTFVDGETGEDFPGWVVRSGRYVYGLREWYDLYHVAPGSYVDLSLGDSPGEIVVNARLFRSKRGEWLRTVTVNDGTFSLEVTRYPVYCEFDELAALGVPDPDAVDALAEKLQSRTLESLVDQVFRDLTVLSLQRAVHTITLYSVVNLFRRVPPALIQAILASGRQFISLGDNYWSYRGEE
ncbi:MAG: hypothetical protein ACP5HM_14970 [Anaerolineae bacterium]